jgi:hypothetical protein
MVYSCTRDRLSIDGEYSGKIFDTDLSVVAAIYIEWCLPGLRSRVTVTLSRILSDPNTKIADGKRGLHHCHRGFNVFQHIPCIVSALPKPNLLHTIYIGVLNSHQKWIYHFIETHE